MRLLLILLVFVGGAALAQPYPSKPVRWIVPTGPGSAVDVNARRVTPKLAEALGQPVIVENRPGANSMIGARDAARAAPDGYTLFQAVVNNAINDALAPDPCCVLNDKLVPVTRLYTTPLVMVVHPGVQATTLQEYVALAKGKPNSLTYAHGGTGAITQMVGELLKLTAGIQVREVPYKAIGAELPDLTGGHVSTAFLSPVVIRDMVRAGKLRALAIADRQRLGILSEVPTMAEAGYPIEGLGWNGIFVPAGTPRAVIERLQQEIARVLQLKDIQDDAAALGTRAGGEKPEEFAAFVRSEVQKWGKVVKDAAIKAQ
ncbi:MAG TPA: tripartite tricarboxylate transporter substrate-binding protein [Burkholderiales bacterium]|nr:tripartite tricarboxylate transporter substrate-binding protein [Burkholderiales bacterium]